MDTRDAAEVDPEQTDRTSDRSLARSPLVAGRWSMNDDEPEPVAPRSGAAHILEAWPERPDDDILHLLVDAHAHPTDYKRFNDEPEYRSHADKLAVRKLCAMSSHLKDQDLVKRLADEHPEHILPAFGLHPWWSHHIYFDATEGQVDKRLHYSTIFPDHFDADDQADDAVKAPAEELLKSFPEPTRFDDYCKNTLRPYLKAFPPAMLGEVGLDRSFRIPVPSTDPKTDREVQRAAKKFTQLRTPIAHQLQLLSRQMQVAFELNRNISMHSVQAQGQTVELVTKLGKTSKTWKDSTSKICMHSYGGSADTVGILCRAEKERIYFSFSTTINGRLDRLADLIRAVPDDRLLIESDYNDMRRSEQRLWEILGVVCHAKQWDAQEAAKRLKENWERFSGFI